MKELKDAMKINPEEVAHSLKNFINQYVDQLEREGVILGLSGGLDSAVVAALCARAVGPQNTLALLLPERDSQKEHKDDAMALAEKLGIKTKLIDIAPYLEKIGAYKLFPLNNPLFPGKLKGSVVNKAYDYYLSKTGESPFAAGMTGLRDKEYGSFLKKGNAYYRVKHRMRMLLFYFYGEKENRLVVGAANKSELEIGYFVKHGCDAATDIMPIMHLYKTQVRELARYLDIPSGIIDKPPSPDIIPGLTDEKAITIPYELLDLILLALEQGRKTDDIASALDISMKKVEDVITLTQRSEHMRHIYVPE